LKITYITNISIKEYSGGGSGVNKATITQLSKYFEINSIITINPSIDIISKIISVFKRKLGFKGNYHFFSERRLKNIKHQFNKNIKNNDNDIYFFHGFTSWIKTTPDKPYFCFNDACFDTYVNIYNDPEEFSTKDIERIYSQEAEWLNNASIVFFRSKWALNETKKQYNISGNNFINVGVGGFIDIPPKDNYSSGYNFLFISREFVPKGGLIVSDAIKIVREKHPEAKLWIVGQPPPNDITQQKGIEYKGFLNKNIKEQKQKLISIFSKTFALVHPTIKDINPLVINELAYFGCPALASNRFAIPEYLLDKKTGFLINNPQDPIELANKMIFMIENPKSYKEMRILSRNNALNNNTWDKVGERIAFEINKSIK